VILNFGRQRETKGIAFLQTLIKRYQPDNLVWFTIGPIQVRRRADPSIGSRLMHKLRSFGAALTQQKGSTNPRSISINRNFAHEEIPRILAACDVMFLGHTSGLNSGVLALAGSYSKPVVFPDLGNFREQATGLLAEPYVAGNIESAIAALDKIRTRVKTESACELGAAWRKVNAWSIQVREILNAAR